MSGKDDRKDRKPDAALSIDDLKVGFAFTDPASKGALAPGGSRGAPDPIPGKAPSSAHTQETFSRAMRSVMMRGVNMGAAAQMMAPFNSGYRRPAAAGRRPSAASFGFTTNTRPEPQPAQNLPSVISRAVFDPNRRPDGVDAFVAPQWHRLSDIIQTNPFSDTMWHRAVALFAAFGRGKEFVEAALSQGRDPVSEILVVADFDGCGPNPPVELDAVSAWGAANTVRDDEMEMDFGIDIETVEGAFGYVPRVAVHAMEDYTVVYVAELPGKAPMRARFAYLLPIGRGYKLSTDHDGDAPQLPAPGR